MAYLTTNYIVFIAILCMRMYTWLVLYKHFLSVYFKYLRFAMNVAELWLAGSKCPLRQLVDKRN